MRGAGFSEEGRKMIVIWCATDLSDNLLSEGLRDFDLPWYFELQGYAKHAGIEPVAAAVKRVTEVEAFENTDGVLAEQPSHATDAIKWWDGKAQPILLTCEGR